MYFRDDVADSHYRSTDKGLVWYTCYIGKSSHTYWLSYIFLLREERMVRLPEHSFSITKHITCDLDRWDHIDYWCTTFIDTRVSVDISRSLPCYVYLSCFLGVSSAEDRFITTIGRDMNGLVKEMSTTREMSTKISRQMCTEIAR